jgi:hypothetical protein
VPSEAVRKLRLVVWALLLEAVLVRRTKDTIQSRFKQADSFVLDDGSIPARLTDHLWSAYSAAERGAVIEAILDGRRDEAMAEILELCDEVGIAVD